MVCSENRGARYLTMEWEIPYG